MLSLATGGKKQKTARGQTQHTRKKLQKTRGGSPVRPGPYAAAGPFAITLWRTPAKLTGNRAVLLLGPPIKAAFARYSSFKMK